MRCSRCQTDFEGNFCPRCGCAANAVPPPPPRGGCPKCGSPNVHVVTETSGTTKGFGFFKGCLGWLLVGPIGWLCGLCGMGKGKTSSDTFRVCGNCGHRFR